MNRQRWIVFLICLLFTAGLWAAASMQIPAAVEVLGNLTIGTPFHLELRGFSGSDCISNSSFNKLFYDANCNDVKDSGEDDLSVDAIDGGAAATATALAANGANCSAGQYPLGVDASGNVEGCASASAALNPQVYTWTGPQMEPLDAADAITALRLQQGTNIDVIESTYTHTGNGCRQVAFIAPSDINTAGNVTFKIVYWETGVETGTVAVRWNIKHNGGLAAGVSYDAALSTVAFNGTIQATETNVTINTNTTAVSTLTWAAGDYVELQLCRDVADGGDTSGAFVQVRLFQVEIPRA